MYKAWDYIWWYGEFCQVKVSLYVNSSVSIGLWCFSGYGDYGGYGRCWWWVWLVNRRWVWRVSVGMQECVQVALWQCHPVTHWFPTHCTSVFCISLPCNCLNCINYNHCAQLWNWLHTTATQSPIHLQCIVIFDILSIAQTLSMKIVHCNTNSNCTV